MAARHVTGFEHQPLVITESPSAQTITPTEAARLEEISLLRPGFCERGYRRVRLANYAGVVSMGDRILEVLPKVDPSAPPQQCRGMLLRLLRAAGRFPLFNDAPVGHHLRKMRLLDVFIAAFFDAVRDLVRAGLMRRYREHEEDLNVVRGRIVANRQFATNLNRPDRVACRFDDLTADNDWNRLVKAGLRSVRPWIESAELDRRWIELMAVFEEVADVPAAQILAKDLVFDRHGVRYSQAIFWVRLILSNMSPGLRAGDNQAAGLLFDMNSLFEAAIGRAIRRQASVVRVRLQSRDRHFAKVSETDGRKVFQLRPDIVIERDGLIIGIADTKWKRIEMGASGHLMPSESDLYQMQAYATAYGCERLTLIYPWYEGLKRSVETTLELPTVRGFRPLLTVACVDLNSAWLQLRRGSFDFEGQSLLNAA